MVHRLWLIGLILAVPLFGIAAVTGLQAYDNWEFRKIIRAQVPDADPQRVAGTTITSFCAAMRARGDNSAADMCAHNDTLRLLRAAAITAISLGLGLIALIWIAGRAARNSRALLLSVFKPGLRITGLSLIVLVVLHAIIAVASLFYLEVTFINRVHFGLILVIILGAAGGALAIAKYALRVATDAHTQVLGLALTHEQAPALWERVRDVATRMNALPPENIVVGADPNFFVTEVQVSCLSGTLTGRTLYCSLPLARILTVDELTGIIGHELGHFKGADTAFSQRFYPIYRGTAQSIVALQHSGGAGSGVIALLPAIALFSYFLECFSTAENTIGRERELVADREGAAVSSLRAMASSLVKIHAFAGVWGQVEEACIAAARQRQAFINVSQTFADATRSAAASPDALANVTSVQIPHPTDSHPPLSTRLESLGVSVEDVAAAATDVQPADAAIRLFGASDGLETQVSDALQRVIHSHFAGDEESGEEQAAIAG